LSAISGERKATSRNRNERPTTEAALVDDRGRQSADVDAHAALLERGNHVVAEAMDEVCGRGSLRRARGHDREERRVAGRVQRRLADERDDGLGAQALGKRG
jgi:hypothetical protein